MGLRQPRIVVVGAGVIGLTTALLLAKKAKYRVTVAAKHMPGDYDIEYASPWAGANYLPVSTEGTDAEKHDRNTWPELEDLAKNHPEAGVHFQDTVRYIGKDAKDTEDGRTQGKFAGESWYKHVMPDKYRVLKGDELPEGFAAGNAFTSVCINTSLYLPWLVSQCLAKGVRFKRAIIDHISSLRDFELQHELACKIIALKLIEILKDAGSLHDDGPANVIVNCTGLSARKLGGVSDPYMVPIRGQTVLVRNTAPHMLDILGIDHGAEELTYIMQRAAGGGTLLGGCYQVGSWDSQPDPNLAVRIMQRAIDVCPSLTGGKGIEHLDIIRQGVGLRPMRTKGTRIERELIKGSWIVHNYGHGGYGYQSSYGCAAVAVELVQESLHEFEGV